MTEEKTKYRKNLEMLLETYKTCYGDCAGDRTVQKLSLLIVMFESSEMFEKTNEGLKEKFIIDIDRDVDYLQWSKPEKWTCEKSKTVSASSLTYESLKMDKSDLFANRMADMLPPVPETSTDYKEKKHQEGLTYTERNRFKDTINNLMNTNVFNDQMLDYAIDAALRKLCAALLKIYQTIDAHHDAELYKQLYDAQLFAYSTQMGSDIRDEHNKWRSRFLGEDVDEQSLQRQAEKKLSLLLKAGVLDGIEANVSKKQKMEYKKEIDFEDYDFPKKMKPYDLYFLFRDIYQYQDGRYTVDKVKAGRLLFKIRKDTDKLEAYFRFVLALSIIYKDIKLLRDANQINSIIDEIDFRTLECKFTEEEVTLSSIKHEPKTVLALIDKMRNGTKSYWLCFYCELQQRGWIEENVMGFCKKMKTLFGIKLDSRRFSSEIRNKGIDMSKWPEEDRRVKKKKDFGLKFKAYIDFYLEYKKQLVFKDLK